MLPAVLTDFDETAAAQNVAEMLLQQFGDNTWLDVRAQFRSGALTLKEYQEIAFRNIKADRTAMQEYVKANANLRPWFGEVWQHCQDRSLPMVIVSHGLDFYIEALLQKEGFPQVPVYAVETSFTGRGIDYKYNFTYPGEPDRGNSKGLVVSRFREQGYRVLYMGDGRSDFEAAVEADQVFAHSVLAEECQREGIPFLPFRDFGDVLTVLQEYAADGCSGV